MDAPTHIETAPTEPNGTAPGTAVARIGELLATMEAELTLHERDVALEDHHIDSWHLEESSTASVRPARKRLRRPKLRPPGSQRPRGILGSLVNLR